MGFLDTGVFWGPFEEVCLPIFADVLLPSHRDAWVWLQALETGL